MDNIINVSCVDCETPFMQAGDFLLCAGNSKLSKAICITQGLAGYSKIERQITHVAGVVNVTTEIANLLRLSFTGLGVFESTTLNSWATPPDGGKRGVQINEYNEWLSNYDGDVYCRRLDFARTPEYHRADAKFVLAAVGLPYESGIPGATELLLCALGLNRFIHYVYPRYTPIETKEIHCSENEAKRNVFVGNFSADTASNRMPPAFWWSRVDRCFNVKVSAPEQVK